MMNEIFESIEESDEINVEDQAETEIISIPNAIEQDTTVQPKPFPSASPNQKTKFVRLPLSRVRQMMKMDQDCAIVQADAIFLVTKATEMFIEFMSKEAAKQLTASKRKTIMKRDVDIAIENVPHLCFLDGALE
ncbi:DNA polymerase epsilon subunit 4 [Cylas formicarius]|uniref:DNA polymerase epsilon subunit 4 n=1 Tax=Cylas formicarius TaxID=197179 RepID=UPI002958D060|nr:DNA polymerase epsilon subunit 4 [Cylas formicarius]